MVRKPEAFPATTVTLLATAVAVAGMLLSAAREKFSVVPLAMVVPPVEERVSIKRVGEASATKELPGSVAEPV